MLFKELGSLDEALPWSRHMERERTVAAADDGTRMDRRAIANALGVGLREEIGGQAI